MCEFVKPLSKLLTVVEEGLQSHHDTCYSCSGINSTWNLINSKDLLEILNSKLLSEYNSNKTYNFSNLYTSILHTQLNSRIKDIIHLCYSEKDGTARYKYVVLGGDSSRFVKKKPIPNHFPNIPKKMFSKCWNYWTTTYLPSVIDAFSTNDRHSEQIVLLYLLTFSFTLMRLNL